MNFGESSFRNGRKRVRATLRALIWPVVRGSPRFGRVIGIIAFHKSLGYLILVGNRQMIRGVGASRRIATGVIVATVAVLLIAVGCGSEPTPSAEVVAAGDIASCRTEGDEATAKLVEATAKLVEATDGQVLVLGDEAYPRGTAANFEECYGPSWGRFKGRTKPVPGNHEYFNEGARGYFEYFGEAEGDPEEGYYSTNTATEEEVPQEVVTTAAEEETPQDAEKPQEVGTTAAQTQLSQAAKTTAA